MKFMNVLDMILDKHSLLRSHLARDIGVSPSTITRLCSGEFSASYDLAVKISNYFKQEISIGDIMSIPPKRK